MSKHCDFCMAKIDQDDKAVQVNLQYVKLLGLDEATKRPALTKKIELCKNCFQHLSEALSKLQKSIFDHLDKATQQLLERLK